MGLRNTFGIFIIITVFIFANIAFLSFYNDVWWDSSVYMGMGKYIFSLGESGLWEASRPLALPFLLGIGWALNFDSVYFGRFLSITFAALVVFLTYKIGDTLFSKKIGLLAAFFTAFSYNFLFFSPNILTEVPSTLFLLLAFYFFIKDRFFLAGIFSGVAIMTRLFQVFTLTGLVLAFFYFYNKPGFAKKLAHFAIGASIVILPYILLNYHLYNDIFLPFKIQAHLTKTTGWMLYREFGFYLTGLFKENFFIVFLFSLPLFFKRNHKFYALLLIPLVYIAIFSFVKHKEMRFMLNIIPFLYLLVSYCLVNIYKKSQYKKFAFAVLSLMIFIWLTLTVLSFKDIVFYKNQRSDEGLQHFQEYLKNNKGRIWITNPVYALYSNEKIDGLLYFYSSDNLIKFISNNKNNADIVMFNSCDIPCGHDDSLCYESRKILNNILSKFMIVYQKEIDSCKYVIYEK